MLDDTHRLIQYTQTVEVPMAPETFTHDLDGNLTQDGAYDYTWDAENRLISVAPAASPVSDDVKLTFVYDYRGRRVRKRVETWSGSAWQTADDLRFVYDDWNLVMELDGRSGNAILRKYAWGPDLSGTLHGAGGIGGLLAVEDTQGTTPTTDDGYYLYFYDGNGNVGQLIDWSTSPGTLAAHYEYDPYGGTILAAGAYTDTNSFRFSTKYYDSETGLYYYSYPYYSSRLGRWMQRDSLEYGASSMNLYEYARSNPLLSSLDTPFLVANPDEVQVEAANGTTICNLSGTKPKVTINNKNCDKSCTSEHEAVHEQMLSTGCCPKARKAYKACKTLQCRNQVLTDWNNYFTKSKGFYECPAYKKGKKCRDKLWKKKNCTKCPAGDKKLKKCCDDIKSGIDRDKKQIKTNCPGKQAKCPF